MQSSSSLEFTTELLVSNYETFTQNGELIILEKSLGSEDLASSQTQDEPTPNHQPQEKTFDDYVFQFYIGSLTVVGLFILFRMIQKSR